MNTQKAAYWLALAVFGLALHSEYKHGSFPALHRAAGCASATLCRLATHVEQSLALAGSESAPPALRTDDFDASAEARELAEARAELAREEAQDKAEQLREQAQDRAEALREQAQDRAQLLRDQARAQAEMIRAQVPMQRAQIEQIHRCVRSQLRESNAVNRRIVVLCPRSRAKVTVQTAKALSDLGKDLSDVEVGDWF